jgi:hypothetical protein
MNDYIKVKAPKDHPHRDKDGLIFEHILVAEQKICRYLTDNESVHHINQVRDDNRPSNLVVMRNSEDHEFIHKHIKKGKS